MPTNWLNDAIQKPCALSAEKAQQRQGQLTKPPGSLGRLEELAITLASLQGQEKPSIKTTNIVVFAADHGITEEGVSAFPQVVTGEMIRNFSRGGAAISVLANTLQAPLQVINLGTAHPIEDLPGVRHLNIAPGTANFAKQSAMTDETLAQALQAGKEVVDALAPADVFIAGEMGIANTSSATALAAVLLNEDASRIAGPGTGLDSAGVQHKADVINAAIKKHRLTSASKPLDVLKTLGGLEIAAMSAAYIRCAQKGIPILVDGFISSVSALIACRLQPDIHPWMIFSHQSAEPGHQRILHAMDAKPLLNMAMRLGEGSGAAVAFPLLQTACALHNNMATFAEADVSAGN
ncbi:MAG: nicotinate-nucleotide--dimethylbenzimidazole phosphoribosyltransferase [Pseudomonadales bacterium]|nr:nicotinate-nucleotide--dimethylbenzimidazole phosphoribosyltransferase [Pseudomonadales bacterium]